MPRPRARLPAGRCPTGRPAGHLWADRRGVAVVEFAFVSIALMMLVMGILHIGFCLFVQSVLDQAAALIAIQIETTGNDPNAKDFQATTICPSMNGLLDCTKVRVALYSVDSFQTLSPPKVNSAGLSRSLMMLTLSYDVPIPTWPVLALTGGNALTVSANVPFVNEF